MELLLNIPAFIKVGAAFAGILIAYRLGLELGFSILGSAAVLTLWTGAGAAGAGHQLHTLAKPESWLLLLVILMLLFFTESLDKSGKIRRTIDALSSRMKGSGLLYMGLPALVGLLPMPGGALFSAPLVNAVDSENRMPASWKASVNYWFRHVWEYWWPLYPGVILAIKYSGLPAGLFFLIQMPFTAAAVCGGYFFLIRPMAGAGAQKTEPVPLNGGAVMSTLAPIAIIVLTSVASSIILPRLGASKSLSSLVGMLAGLTAGLVVVFWNNPAAARRSCRMFLSGNTWLMMVLVLGIVVFSAALSCPLSGNSAATLVTQMRDEFVMLGIPLLLVIALIPFISGAVTGVAFGYVGASFPIVFALLGPSPALNVVCAATVFAYGCGYFGMILSPVHVCFVVTNEYFKTGMFASYRRIIGPASVVLFACLVMSAAYYFVLK